MEPRNAILWTLLVVLAVLVMSAGVQAQELREVPASEILGKIQAGEDVNYTNVRVTGELDLSRIELETVSVERTWREIEYFGLKEESKLLESKITIKDSIFETDVNFQNTQFRECFNFQNTSFLGKTDFNVTIFGCDAHFEDVCFVGDAHFEDARFGGSAHFEDANFVGDANFRDANFVGDAYFEYARFGGSAHFKYASFGIGAYFYGASFGGDADFWSAIFVFYTNFEYASFGGDADFEYASFGGDADFEYANFGGDTYFLDASFDGDADFGSVGFGGDAIFNSTEFNKVSFADITFINVSFYEADFKSMKVEWVSLEDVLVFDGLTYIKLIKNFREMEQFKDADDAYYQYRRQSQANKEWSFSKLGDIFIWLSCGYGVKPWRTAAWAVAIVLIFTPFYFWRGGIKRLKENNEDEKQDVSRYDAFYFSMTTFTTLGYGDLYPADRYRMVAVMIEGLLGWLILALFLVTLANVMIRP